MWAFKSRIQTFINYLAKPKLNLRLSSAVLTASKWDTTMKKQALIKATNVFVKVLTAITAFVIAITGLIGALHNIGIF